ncbi:MAG: putative drug exporter of the superfamily, partial [Gaiellaceae bacterium]|nr:putative drug exporter of the superfamily [Gaiellaceae bacterium]
MEPALARLAALVSRRRRAVVAAWLVLLLAGGWFTLHQSDHLSGGGWEVPGSQSVKVADALDEFPGVTPPAFTVLVTDPHGVRAHLQRARRLAAGEPSVQVGRALVIDGGAAAFLPLGYAGKTSNTIDEASRLRRLLVDPHTRVIGEAAIWSNFQTVSKQQLQRGESIGFPLILLILLAGFGTLAAAIAPVALGAVAVFLSGAVVYWLSRSFTISVYVTNMASMIGIGVAVDYSLFIVSRFRRELHDGATQDEALHRALASSGTAVVFSGLTVAVSLAALFAIDVNALRSMAVGAIVVVCISVLASVTLLPALLAAAGSRIDRFRLRLPWRTGEEGSDALWTRWAHAVMRRPVIALVGGAAVMIVLSTPLLAMRTFNRGLAELPANAEVRVATQHAASLAGPGFASPVHVLTTTRPSTLLREIARIPGVERVGGPVRSRDGTRWLFDVRLAAQPESQPARDIVHRIESLAGPQSLVGGSTVFDLDVQHAIFGGLWKMLLFILAACYVVLLVLLRSVVLPLKAVL